MKKIIIIIFTLILLSVNFIFANEPDTVGYYSPTISFEVDAKTQIQSVKQTLISADTNRLEIYLLLAINGDSFGIYVNNNLIDTITIQDNVLTVYCDVNISIYDNAELKFYVYYEGGNYLAYSDLLLDNKGFYSPVISFTVGDTTPAFIFNLSEIKSDYFRYKKLTELYPQLSDYYFGSYEYWYNLALLENDVYYRQPNLPYLKFKRLAAKYK